MKYFFSRHIDGNYHTDGNHKLKRWRIVMHCVIEEYSQMITYLQCNNNDLAATVLHLFIVATSIHGLPSRVRANFSAKNVDVVRFMLDSPERGNSRGSFTAGNPYTIGA